MKITRNVILDLLPLYLADEASPDTRALVEDYLRNDPSLAKIAKQTSTVETGGETLVPLTVENKMRAFTKAKSLMYLYAGIFAVLTAGALVALLFAFFRSS